MIGNVTIINTLTTWGAGSSIANSSVTYYIRMLGSVFQQANLPLYALTGDIIIRTFFNFNAIESSIMLTLISYNALVEFEELLKEFLAQLLQDY